MKAIKGEVGMVMIQDQESAKKEGMPRSAIATGLVDYVLPPGKMPEQLIKCTKHVTQKAAARIAPVEGPIPQALQKIFLGSSETIGPATDLFAFSHKKWKIFRCRPSVAAAHPVLDFPAQRESYQARDLEVPEAVQSAEELSALQLVETILEQSDTPRPVRSSTTPAT